MVEVKELARQAASLKEKGLNEQEIADELHVAADTVKYLLEEGEDGALPPSDIKVGWRSLGINGTRIGLMSEIIADIILEETGKRDSFPEAVVGIAINGVPFATYLSELMDLDLIRI